MYECIYVERRREKGEREAHTQTNTEGDT